MIDRLHSPGRARGRVGLKPVVGLALLSVFLLVLFPEGPDPLERPSAAPVTPQAAASSAATGLMRVAHHN